MAFWEWYAKLCSYKKYLKNEYVWNNDEKSRVIANELYEKQVWETWDMVDMDPARALVDMITKYGDL